MVYVQRIFKKEITIQIETHTEKNIDYVVRRIKNYITKRFYDCDIKIVEGKLMVETDKNQAKVQIEYCKQKLKLLHREKEQSSSIIFRALIDKNIKTEKDKIRKFEKLL